MPYVRINKYLYVYNGRPIFISPKFLLFEKYFEQNFRSVLKRVEYSDVIGFFIFYRWPRKDHVKSQSFSFFLLMESSFLLHYFYPALVIIYQKLKTENKKKKGIKPPTSKNY